MKQLLITIAALVLVGCGESQKMAPAPEAESTEPLAEAAKPEPPTAKAPDISIHRAVEDENIEAVKQHLAAGTDVNEHDSIQSPLHYAAQSYSKEIVDLLIANGADVNAKDRTGSPPLHWAVLKGQKDIVELLIEAGADMYVRKKRGGDNLLHIAALRGHKEVAEMLIVKGFDVNSRNDEEETPFYNTAVSGHAEVAKLFIEKGADVNAKDKYGETPLDKAIGRKHTETAELLRKHGGKSGAEFSIHTAAQLGNIESVKQHLAAGADVNARDDDGFTPLHRAALEYNKKIPELLVAKGADVNAMILSGRYKGYTPLDFATTFNRTEIAELLRKHGGKTGE